MDCELYHVQLCALHSGQVLPDSAALEMWNKMALCSNHVFFVLHEKIFVFNLLKLMNKTKVLSQLHFPFQIELFKTHDLMFRVMSL